MDRIVKTIKTEQQSIYEIYRACRLCGAGAGYKMPIIQNVVDMDINGVELTQKIRECVQIEVHPEDKMPPLICELCVDKVNDFYEFMELCQRTNKRTRMRLGLPAQTAPKTANSDVSSISGDCILGVTEPVYQNDDSDEPLAPVTRRGKQTDAKIQHVKKENTSKQKRPPTPPRSTRHAKTSSEDTMSLSSLKQKAKKTPSKAPSPPQPKSILKKEVAAPVKKEKIEESPMPVKQKRPRETPKTTEVPSKKVKLSVPPSRKPGPRSRRPPSPPPAAPRSRRPPSPPPAAPRSRRPPSPPPAPEHPCLICGKVNASPQALSNHHRSHTVTYTSPRLACNACHQWFSSFDEAQAHHKWHRTKHKAYRCSRCRARHDSLARYTGHIEAGECVPWPEVPDKQCDVCWHAFPTAPLLRAHHCGGEDARPGGKCSKCKRSYALLKNLKKHEATCTPKKKAEIKIDPSVRARLLPAQVRVARCDALLARTAGDHYDVETVKQAYGLDRSCFYPYLSTRVVKSELPEDSMVKIKAELDDYELEDFVHWDSDTDSDGEGNKKVDALSTLSLKKIFSKQCLGKVPKKRRKLKMEKNAFDSLLNASDFETTFNRDINNIIDNLNNDDDMWNTNLNDKNDDENQNASDEESLLTNYVFFDNVQTSNNEKNNDVENSNDSQSILDSNAKVSDDSVRKDNDVSNDSDKNNDKGTEDSGKEKEAVDESVKDTAQDILRVSSDENNKESKKQSDASNMDSTDTGINITRTENQNAEDNYKTENTVNVISINKKDSTDLIDNTSNIIDNDSKPESTKDNLNENLDRNEIADCTDDMNIRNSSENTSTDIASIVDNVSIHNETNTENKEQNLNNDNDSEINDTGNKNNDTEIKCNDAEINNDIENQNNAEITSNASEITNDITDITNNRVENSNQDTGSANNDTGMDNNDTESKNNDVNRSNEFDDSNANKTMNGQVEEKSDKLSFGDMNDISDTEVDDRKLMDALNEHLGESDFASLNNQSRDRIKENNYKDINDTETATQSEAKNAEEDSNEQNGAKTELINSYNMVSDINNEYHSNDHENAINALLSENNDRNRSDNRANDENEKISLEDLLPPKSDAKSMDLDSISDDDFDFDAC